MPDSRGFHLALVVFAIMEISIEKETVQQPASSRGGQKQLWAEMAQERKTTTPTLVRHSTCKSAEGAVHPLSA